MPQDTSTVRPPPPFTLRLITPSELPNPMRCNGNQCASCRQHAQKPDPHTTISGSHLAFQYTVDNTGCIRIGNYYTEPWYTAPVLSRGMRNLFYPSLVSGASIHPVQANALQRWHTWIKPCNLRPKIRAECFDLRYIFQVFDDYFFRRALRSCVRLVWIEGQARVLGYYGRAGRGVDTAYPNDVQIQIVKPDAWTEESIQHLLSVLIHEMAHAVFQKYKCQCMQCSCYDQRARGTGFTGHGTEWKTLAQAMEAELRRSFPGFQRIWRIHGCRRGDFADLIEEKEFRRRMRS